MLTCEFEKMFNIQGIAKELSTNSDVINRHNSDNFVSLSTITITISVKLFTKSYRMQAESQSSSTIASGTKIAQ